MSTHGGGATAVRGVREQARSTAGRRGLTAIQRAPSRRDLGAPSSSGQQVERAPARGALRAPKAAEGSGFSLRPAQSVGSPQKLTFNREERDAYKELSANKALYERQARVYGLRAQNPTLSRQSEQFNRLMASAARSQLNVLSMLEERKTAGTALRKALNAARKAALAPLTAARKEEKKAESRYLRGLKSKTGLARGSGRMRSTGAGRITPAELKANLDMARRHTDHMANEVYRAFPVYGNVPKKGPSGDETSNARGFLRYYTTIAHAHQDEYTRTEAALTAEHLQRVAREQQRAARAAKAAAKKPHSR